MDGIKRNEDLSCDNHSQKRLLLEKVLRQESRAVHASSLEVLNEFENIEDDL